MMKTRFVRRKLRPRGRLSEEIAVASREQDLAQLPTESDSREKPSSGGVLWTRYLTLATEPTVSGWR
jgi:hypothetical protein